MTAEVLAKTSGMSREDWLALRTTGIGGSDIAAIMGLTPRYRTQIDVWLEKTGQAPIDTRPPFIVDGVEYPSEAAYWGVQHEDTVAAHFSKVNGWKVFRRNAMLHHHDYPWMLGNVDREVLTDHGRQLLEIKTASAYLKDDWDGDTVPLSYQAQCQWYLGITGYQRCYVAALVGGNTYRQSVIERDDEVIAALIEAGQAFWQHVLDKTMPPVDGSEKCADALADLYPQSNGECIELPLPLVDELPRYDALKAQIAELEAAATLIENQIKAEMGENEQALAGGRKVSWKTVASKRLDTKAIQAEHAALCDEFMRETTSRRFVIAKEK